MESSGSPDCGSSWPALAQVVLTDTGAVKAIFGDNDVLVLSSCGGHYWLASPQAALPVGQLCEFALSQNCVKLFAALEFRNLHHDVPFLPSRMRASAGCHAFTLPYRIDHVCWPDSLPDAQQRQCVRRMEDGKLFLKSTDGFCSMVLHPSQRLAVCYPLLVQVDGHMHTYVWQNQLFSSMTHPARWTPAVELLLTLAASQEAPDTGPSSPPSPAPPQHHPAPPAIATSMLRTTDLPTACAPAPAVPLDDVEPGSWWLHDTITPLPSSVHVATAWLPAATYQQDLHSGTVHVWIHQDRSCLSVPLAGRFLSHTQASGAEACHSLENLPDVLYVAGARCSYSLHGLVLQARAIQRPPRTPPATRGAPGHLGPSSHHLLPFSTPDSTPPLPDPIPSTSPKLPNTTPAQPPQPDSRLAHQTHHTCPAPQFATATTASPSTTVTDKQNVEGLGEFRAYADGSIRVFFLDRTILSMDPGMASCKAIMRNGDAVEVWVANPIGVAPYVQAAVEYARWLRRDPQQAADEERVRAAVDLQLTSTRRMAAICAASSGVGRAHMSACGP